MALITKADFLATKDEFTQAPKKIVEIYEGAEVYVSAFNAKASFELLTASKEDEEVAEKTDIFEIVRMCTFDANGVALFDTVEEVHQLQGKVFTILVNAAMEMNKILNADDAIEEAEKNLEEVDS